MNMNLEDRNVKISGTSKTVPKWNFFKYLVDHHGDIVQVTLRYH